MQLSPRGALKEGGGEQVKSGQHSGDPGHVTKAPVLRLSSHPRRLIYTFLITRGPRKAGARPLPSLKSETIRIKP